MRTINALSALLALFVVPPAASAAPFTVLHSFAGADGASPRAGVTLSGTTLYGTTSSGGSLNHGTIFAMNSDGSGYHLVHDYTLTSDGANPLGGVTVSGSTLYGTTTLGGDGTVFRANTDGTGYVVLAFFHGPDGIEPAGNLTLSGNTLYGTTIGSYSPPTGEMNNGEVFQIDANGRGFGFADGFAVVHKSTGSDVTPRSIALSGSTIYGVNDQTGSTHGAVYAVGADGTNFRTLHTLSAASEGSSPNSVALVGSTLYGTTSSGGANGLGEIFSVNTDGSNFQVLHSFTGADGSSPSGLIAAHNMLYGAATTGGIGGGTLFGIHLDGTGFTVLHAFDPTTDGSSPNRSLTFDALSLTLLGTTSSGGVGGDGTVFVQVVPEPAMIATAGIALAALAIGALSRPACKRR